MGETESTFGVPAHESPDIRTTDTGGAVARLINHGAEIAVQPLASVIWTNTVS